MSLLFTSLAVCSIAGVVGNTCPAVVLVVQVVGAGTVAAAPGMTQARSGTAYVVYRKFLCLSLKLHHTAVHMEPVVAAEGGAEQMEIVAVGYPFQTPGDVGKAGSRRQIKFRTDAGSIAPSDID